jgi:hypothetical protein
MTATDAHGSLHEGTDFNSTSELAQHIADRPRHWTSSPLSEELAERIATEVRWLHLTGALPGGNPWDQQPAWRVELWETALAVDELARIRDDIRSQSEVGR